MRYGNVRFGPHKLKQKGHNSHCDLVFSYLTRANFDVVIHSTTSTAHLESQKMTSRECFMDENVQNSDTKMTYFQGKMACNFV